MAQKQDKPTGKSTPGSKPANPQQGRPMTGKGEPKR